MSSFIRSSSHSSSHSSHSSSHSHCAIRGAGVILMWKEASTSKGPRDQKTRYLLLKGRDTGIWSFAKGHTDVKDLCPLDTAVREVKEESGLRVEKDYKITKHSVRFGKNLYWEAEILQQTDFPRIVLRPREHSAYLWVTVEEIRAMDASKVNRDIREWLRLGTAVHQRT